MGGAQEQPGSEAAGGNLVSRSIDDFVSQLRGFTDRARSMAGAVPARLHLLALPSPPGAMSAAQLRAVAQTVRAQLDAFDQQLAVFERLLEPLVDWSASWARLEEAVGDFVRPPGAGEGGRTPEV